MKQRPRISIVTIFLNAERFLEEAIGSVLAQSFEDWEYLLVDDGSSDRSKEIALDYAQKMSGKIRYLEHAGHANRGMAASRNRGLEEASGEFVAFLDADDVWYPRKLEEQLAILSHHSRAALVYGRAEIWLSWSGQKDENDFFLDLGVKPDSVLDPPNLLHLLLDNKHQSPMPSSFLVRREAVAAVGGFEEAFRGIFEDHAFLTKLGLKFPVFVSSAIWLRYRQHRDSCCATAELDGKAKREKFALLCWMRRYFAEQRVSDPSLRRHLDQELWPLEHPLLAGAGARLQRVGRRLRTAVQPRKNGS